MKKYLYDAKAIVPCCELCEHGAPDQEDEFILCKGKRMREKNDRCRRFRYDPLKRRPKRSPSLPRFDPDEFKL